jgi:hypothetical protein
VGSDAGVPGVTDLASQQQLGDGFSSQHCSPSHADVVCTVGVAQPQAVPAAGRYHENGEAALLDDGSAVSPVLHGSAGGQVMGGLSRPIDSPAALQPSLHGGVSAPDTGPQDPDPAAEQPGHRMLAVEAAAAGSTGDAVSGLWEASRPQPQAPASAAPAAGKLVAARVTEAAGPASPAPGPCESLSGGVPGTSPEERAAFEAALHSHWRQEQNPDFMQGKCESPCYIHEITSVHILKRLCLATLCSLHQGEHMMQNAVA